MRTLLQITGLGLLAGSRSIVVPALLSAHLANRSPRPAGGLARWLASRWVARAIQWMAFGELVGDKLPTAPARIAPPALIARGTMGALVGITLSQLGGRSWLVGALLGGASAVTGAFIGYHWRVNTVEDTGLPDLPVALAEDVVVIGGGRALVWLTPTPPGSTRGPGTGSPQSPGHKSRR